MASPFSILLADDHVMFRRGIRRIIQSINDVEVVGEASDGFELLELVKKTSPQLVIMDISMPNLRGLEATREIKIINPAVKVLILTMHKDKEYLYHAFSAGAEGYLLKEDADSELLSAIDTLRRGGTYISPLLSTQLADLFMQKSRPGAEQMTSPREPLTTREREIIKLIAEGKSSKEVADLLFISSRTVQHHRANVMRKLNLKKTADLVKYALQKGYTAPAE
ncbi:MAG: response regulator transcription factor [Deltaproteobacteria bacterium]|nr:response regulator transcription factor [Deltaproteobacteria bacterium]